MNAQKRCHAGVRSTERGGIRSGWMAKGFVFVCSGSPSAKDFTATPLPKNKYQDNRRTADINLSPVRKIRYNPIAANTINPHEPEPLELLNAYPKTISAINPNQS